MGGKFRAEVGCTIAPEGGNGDDPDLEAAVEECMQLAKLGNSHSGAFSWVADIEVLRFHCIMAKSQVHDIKMQGSRAD